MDALSTATAELQGGALMNGSSGGSLCAAVLGPLIRAVGAVHVTVAGPQARYANTVVALEGCRGAGGGRAGGLVTAIVTVRLIVTHKGGGHALAVPAAEFIVCALPGHWEGRCDRVIRVMNDWSEEMVRWMCDLL